MTRCLLLHQEPGYRWCPYCPKGEARRHSFYLAALRAVRKRWRNV